MIYGIKVLFHSIFCVVKLCFLFLCVYIGSTPQIQFPIGNNNTFVYKKTSAPFNLTATVVSALNLTSLYWSPPEYSDPLPNRTIIVHHDNITTITFMLLRHASLGDSGNYTLTAVNECGRSSSQVRVEVLTGKTMEYSSVWLSIRVVLVIGFLSQQGT